MAHSSRWGGGGEGPTHSIFRAPFLPLPVHLCKGRRVHRAQDALERGDIRRPRAQPLQSAQPACVVPPTGRGGEPAGLEGHRRSMTEARPAIVRHSTSRWCVRCLIRGSMSLETLAAMGLGCHMSTLFQPSQPRAMSARRLGPPAAVNIAAVGGGGFWGQVNLSESGDLCAALRDSDGLKLLWHGMRAWWQWWRDCTIPTIWQHHSPSSPGSPSDCPGRPRLVKGLQGWVELPRE